MKIIILTGTSNPLSTQGIKELFEISKNILVIFLKYNKKLKNKNFIKNIKNNGFVFSVIKFFDILFLKFRLFLFNLGFYIKPFYPLEIVKQKHIDHMYTTDINQDKTIQQIVLYKPDYIITIGFGQILKKNIITLSQRLSFNIHPSLLPKHKGTNPFYSIVKSKDKETGITLHKLSEKVDEGEIIKQLKYKSPRFLNQISLRIQASKKCAEILNFFFDKKQIRIVNDK